MFNDTHNFKNDLRMKRTIKKVAVLGSGIMGSRIAAHFANIGLKVLLLDIKKASKKMTQQ